MGYFGKISCRIFWQNICRNILAKYHLLYINYFLFDIMVKYFVKYIGKIFPRYIFGKIIIFGFWFGQSHPFSFCGNWVQGICLSLVSEKKCRSKEKAIASSSDKFERHKYHVQDPNGSLCRLNMIFYFRHVVDNFHHLLCCRSDSTHCCHCSNRGRFSQWRTERFNSRRARGLLWTSKL